MMFETFKSCMNYDSITTEKRPKRF